MTIVQPHSLPQPDAAQRVDGFLDAILASPPAGVAIKTWEKSWDGPVMTWMFQVDRWPFNPIIRGTASVTESTVELDVQVPPIVLAVVSEDEIRQGLTERLAAVLGEAAAGPTNPTV